MHISTLSKNNKKTGYIEINSKAVERYIKSISTEERNFSHIERALPLIVAPAKWLNSHVGGYYL